MKKLLGILLFTTILLLSAFASETVNLTEFPDADTIISWSDSDGITYPIEQPNGIYGTKAQISPEYPSDHAFTDEEKANLADIGYGVSIIGIKKFGRNNALRNLVDGCLSGANAKMSFMYFDDNMYDVDGTVNTNGKYRALITLNFSTTHRFDACGFISGTQAGMINAADIYVSDDGENWALVPSASYDASNGEKLIDLATDTVKTPADTWTGYTESPFATLFDMGGVSGQYIRIAVITGRTGSSDPNTVNTREFLVYGEQTGKDNPLSRTDVLFIGNSFTYVSEMPERFFAPISRSAGYNVYATKITNGGQYLYEHGNINDEFGAQVYSALANNSYDYVFIQEQSTNSIKDPESFYTAVRRIVNLVNKNGATPILYCTWGHKAGSSYIPDGWDTESMTYGIAAAYTAIGNELGVKVSHPGFAFFDVHSNHGDTINLYLSDNYHQSEYGAYLSAMTHFTSVLGGNPLLSNFNYTFDEATTAILKQAAYDATYNTPEIPEKYKTSSVGIGTDGLFGIDASKTVVLTEYPDSPMISVVQKDGTFSGITGDKGTVASDKYTDTAFTAEEKADIADISYGVSMIGIKSMITSAAGYKKAIANLVNGHWGSSLMSSVYYGDERYDINGNVSQSGKYRALYTLNFGSQHKFDAIGFFSGNALGIASAADVYVSDDGVNWTIVPTACYDGINHTSYINLAPTPKDPYNGNTAGYAVLFGMNGVTGKYIRMGIAVGRSNTYANYNSINTRELVVYGTTYPLGDADRDGNTNISDVLSTITHCVNNLAYNTYRDTNGDSKITLLDAIRILKECVK
ncbi:MAG: hypothetical protein E7598_02205 [Ruminococcaceae bacterium]|nr:hypothetical protein [Oscillospiraceae bacterium]